jgi:hypothetical protein
MRAVKKTWRREQMERKAPAQAGVGKPRISAPMRRNEWTTRCYEQLDLVRAGCLAVDERRVMMDSCRRGMMEQVDSGDSRTFGLLCYTGCTMADSIADHDSAAEFLSDYFCSPLADADEKSTRLANRLLLAHSVLRLGRDSEAVALYRQLIATASRADLPTIVGRCRDHLLEHCDGQMSDSAASPHLAALAADIASRLRRKKNASQIVPGQSGFGLLAVALRSTREPAR